MCNFNIWHCIIIIATTDNFMDHGMQNMERNYRLSISKAFFVTWLVYSAPQDRQLFSEALHMSVLSLCTLPWPAIDGLTIKAQMFAKLILCNFFCASNFAKGTVNFFKRTVLSMILNLSSSDSSQSVVVGAVHRELRTFVIVCVCNVFICALVVTLFTFVWRQ